MRNLYGERLKRDWRLSNYAYRLSLAVRSPFIILRLYGKSGCPNRWHKTAISYTLQMKLNKRIHLTNETT